MKRSAQKAEIDNFLRETCESRPSAAKAGVDLSGLMYGLKPVPFKEVSFSAGVVMVRLESKSKNNGNKRRSRNGCPKSCRATFRKLPTPVLPGSGSKGFSQPRVRGAPLFLLQSYNKSRGAA